MQRLILLLLCLLLVSIGSVSADNETETDTLQLLRKRLGDISAAFVVSGCTPTAAGGLTVPAFACEANVRDAEKLIPVKQDAVAVGPLPSGTGLFWLALHTDRTSVVSGWNRQRNTHYLWQANGVLPASGSGVFVVARVSMTAGSITTITPIGNHFPIPPSTAGLGVSAAEFGVRCDGSNTGPALQFALDTVPAGSRLVLPPGSCTVAQTLTIAKSLTLQGSGVNHTYLFNSTAALPTLTLQANDIHLRDFTVARTATATAGGDGIVVNWPVGLNNVYLENLRSTANYRGFVLGGMFYGWATNLLADHNNSHGFEFLYPISGAPTQWEVSQSLSQLNQGAGFGGTNTDETNGIGPWLSRTLSFANQAGGFTFSGTPGHLINDLRLTDVLSSVDNADGIYLNTYGAGHVIVNPWIELTGQNNTFGQGTPEVVPAATNSGHCITVTVNNLPGLSITGGHYWKCAWSGLTLESPGVHFTGGIIREAGQALSGDPTKRAGVHIANERVLVSGVTFEEPFTFTQNYIYYTGTLTNLAVGHNTYSPNLALGNYINTSGATLAGASPPILAGGTAIHTNKVGTDMAIVDATSGATPSKHVRVNGGALEILNNAFSTVLHSLSDVGTPSWPTRRGQVTIADAATTATVTLSPAEPDNAYFIQLTPTVASGGPGATSLAVGGVQKFAGSFQVIVQGAPGAGKFVIYDWLVYR